MNMYVGNLNYRVKEGDLEQAMAAYGVVICQPILPHGWVGSSRTRPEEPSRMLGVAAIAQQAWAFLRQKFSADFMRNHDRGNELSLIR